MKCKKLFCKLSLAIIFLFCIYFSVAIYSTFIVQKPDGKITDTKVSIINSEGRVILTTIYTVNAYSRLNGRILVTVEDKATNVINIIEEFDVDIPAGIHVIRKDVHLPNNLSNNICYIPIYYWKPYLSWVFKKHNIEPKCFNISEVTNVK